MVEVSVVRWRKYGRDRLYVQGSEGQRLGFADLVSGAVSAELPEHLPDVERAVRQWRDGQTPVPAAPAPPALSGEPVAVASHWVDPEAGVNPGPASAPTVPVVAEQWEDLAGRRAGQMAREQAVARRKAAPVRTFVARVLRVHTEERAWRIGADGEEMVGAQLSKLARKDPRWHTLHAVPVGENGSDVDHVVIGPGGVFTLNAKHHTGAKIWIAGNTFMVNGLRQPYVRNSRHEAARAQRLLEAASGVPLWATGVIVPVGAAALTIKTAPDGVYVMNRMRLAKWLQTFPELLDDASIERIYDAARRSTTWRPLS